jgi:hypothetical protein
MGAEVGQDPGQRLHLFTEGRDDGSRLVHQIAML